MWISRSRLRSGLFAASILASYGPASGVVVPPHGNQPKILVLNSYHPDYTWTRGEMAGISSVLHGKAQLFVEYLDLKRYEPEVALDAITDVLTKKYRDTRFEVVVTTDVAALRYAAKHQRGLLGHAPIVFAGVERNHYDALTMGRFSGVLEDDHWLETTDLILKLHPNPAKVLVVADPLSFSLHESVDTIAASIRNAGVVCEVIFVDDPEELRKRLVQQPPGTVILAGVLEAALATEWSGRVGLMTVLNQFGQFPVYVGDEATFSEGAFGGAVKSAEFQGREVAKLALKSMAGELKTPILLDSPNQALLDARRLAKYGVALDSVPANVKLMNLPDPVQTRTRFFIKFEALLLVLLLGVVAWLTRSVLRKKRAKEIAELANVTKSRFIASVSHELRTPLTAILGFSELMESDLSKDDEWREQMHIIRCNAQLLLALVNDVLDVSKVESGKLDITKTDVNVRNLVDEVLTLQKFANKKKGLSIEGDLAPAVPETIFTDPVRLKQILINVVGNAIKFTSQGAIRLDVRPEKRDGKEGLVFDVTDEGLGISDADRSKLFAPFVQLKSAPDRTQSGTGLGLYLAKRLATALGGGLDLVCSKPGQGSTFRVFIA